MRNLSFFKNILPLIGAMLSYFASFLYAVVFDNSTGWVFFFFLTFLILIDLVSLLPSLKKISGELVESKTYEIGTASTLSVEIFRYRPTFLSIPELEIYLAEEQKATQEVLFLYSGNKKEITFQWMPLKRGVFQQLPVAFIAHDLLGCLYHRGTLSVKGPYIVLPQEQRLLVKSLYQQLSKRQTVFAQSLGQRSYTIRNFRSYQDGDALGMIDWKQSCKRNELIVKEYEVESESSIHFIFYGFAHEKFEAILSVYYSFIQLVEAEMDFKQTILADYAPQLRGKELFASITPTEKEQPLPVISRKKIVVFAPHQTNFLTQQLSDLQRTNEVFLILFKKNQLYLNCPNHSNLIPLGGDEYAD